MQIAILSRAIMGLPTAAAIKRCPITRTLEAERRSHKILETLKGSRHNDGKTPQGVTVKEVPGNAFWSIAVYNADGYLEANDLGVNSYNNFSAKPNENGSITIHFGGDPKSVNYLPITKGWNYAIHMYQPRKEILDGTCTFPSIEPVK